MSLRKKIKRLISGPSYAELEKQLSFLREEADIYKAATWYGNTVPLWANKDGVENWRASQLAFQGAVDPAVHDEFTKVGHVIREDLFPNELIQRMTAAFDKTLPDPQKASNPFFDSPKLLKAYSYGPMPGTVPDCRRDLKDAARDLPMWKELFSDTFVNLIRSCLGSNFTINSVHAAQNSHCPPEFIKVFEPFSDRWHFDDQHSDTVYIFTYLKPVDMTQGPFHVHNLENSRRLLRLGYDKRKRCESVGCGLDPSTYENPPSTKLTGPAGATMITMNALCLHRAGTPDFGKTRELLYIKLRPSKELNLIPDGNKPSMMTAAKS